MLDEIKYIEVPLLPFVISLVSFICFFVCIYFFVKKKYNKINVIFLSVFFLGYFFLMLLVTLNRISMQLKLLKFKDDLSRSNNKEYLRILNDYTNDTGETFSFVFNIFPSLLLSLLFLFGLKLLNYFKRSAR